MLVLNSKKQKIRELTEKVNQLNESLKHIPTSWTIQQQQQQQQSNQQQQQQSNQQKQMIKQENSQNQEESKSHSEEEQEDQPNKLKLKNQKSEALSSNSSFGGSFAPTLNEQALPSLSLDLFNNDESSTLKPAVRKRNWMTSQQLESQQPSKSLSASMMPPPKSLPTKQQSIATSKLPDQDTNAAKNNQIEAQSNTAKRRVPSTVIERANNNNNLDSKTAAANKNELFYSPVAMSLSENNSSDQRGSSPLKQKADQNLFEKQQQRLSDLQNQKNLDIQKQHNKIEQVKYDEYNSPQKKLKTGVNNALISSPKPVTPFKLKRKQKKIDEDEPDDLFDKLE